MEDLVPFGSGAYWVTLAILAFARSMDFLSTWVATPHLVLEGNPLAKKLGWKYGIALNVVFAVIISLWPLPALVIATTSVLVAARNFQQAWLMRTMGEEAFRVWHFERIRETRISLYLFCLFGQTALIALVGGTLVWFSPEELAPVSIGLGIVGYALAVLVYTLLAIWRMRRSMD